VPEELGLAAPLWTRRAVQELIRREYGLRMPVVAVREYLRQWGYSPRKSCLESKRQNSNVVRQWLENTYPALEARAAAEGGEIHWGDEIAVGVNDHPELAHQRVADVPSPEGAEEPQRPRMISTVTNQGQVRFMTWPHVMTPAIFIVFLGRLLRGGKRKI